MANIVYSSLLVDSNEASSIQLGMRALPLYYRSFILTVRGPLLLRAAPHHMIRVGLAVPKKRKYPGPQVVGLGVVLCALCSLVGCSLHQKRVYMV